MMVVRHKDGITHLFTNNPGLADTIREEDPTGDGIMVWFMGAPNEQTSRSLALGLASQHPEFDFKSHPGVRHCPWEIAVAPRT